MGQPVQPDPDFPPGVDCMTCTPDPWPSGMTPHRIRLAFVGVLACSGFPPFPNDKAWFLYQDPYNTCAWHATVPFGGHSWFIRWQATNGAVQVRITTLGNIIAFAGSSTTCLGGRTTNNTSCTWNSHHSGHAYPFWLPQPHVTQLAITQNFMPELSALYDITPAADPGQLCIRLTGRCSQGSCLFLYEP